MAQTDLMGFLGKSAGEAQRAQAPVISDAIVFSLDPGEVCGFSAKRVRSDGRARLILGGVVDPDEEKILGLVETTEEQVGRKIDLFCVERPEGFTGQHFNPAPVIQTAWDGGIIKGFLKGRGYLTYELLAREWRTKVVGVGAAASTAIIKAAVDDYIDGLPSRGHGLIEMTACKSKTPMEHVRDAAGLGLACAWALWLDGVAPKHTTEAQRKLDELIDKLHDKKKVKGDKARARNKQIVAMVAAWADVPVGTPVIVTLDSGAKIPTVTRSAPWRLGKDDGEAVIKVDGISGGFLLDRVIIDRDRMQK